MQQVHLEWTAAPPGGKARSPLPKAALDIEERLSTALWAEVMAMLHDRHEASEIVEAVLIHAWTRAGEGTTGESLTLDRLKGFARRRAIERLRQRRACARGLQRLAAECAPPRHGRLPADGGVRPAELRGVLHGLIQCLPTVHRQILTLSLLRDLTPHEIAICLGLPLTTVRQRLDLGLSEIASAVVSLRREVD